MLDILNHLVYGFQIALLPINILYAFIGCLVGTIIGILPGIGPAGGMALLIPLTYGKEPASAIILLAGIYYGAMYGGSTTSILLNVPGEAASVVTTLDGYQMAKKGQAGPALFIAAIGSFIAGTIGIVLLMLIGPPLGRFALRFGPAESFALMIFGLSMVSSLAGRSLRKGLVSTTFGLMLATVGSDLPTGILRFTFGIPKFMEGFDIVVVAIGLFAVSEILTCTSEMQTGEFIREKVTGIWLSMKDFIYSLGAIFRGTFLGFFIGILPGAAHVTASFLSYTLEKRFSKNPERFGHGEIRGVAAPEAANNAAACGALIPLLTMGLPASAVTAVMYGALLMVGVRPSPFLFQKHPDVVWGLIASLYFGNVMLLILNLPLIPLWVKILSTPSRWLFPIVLVLSFVGVYSVNRSPLDLLTATTLGLLGYAMVKLDYPLAPVILGLVLGDLMEQALRQTLMISGGSLRIFLRSPIALTLFGLAAATIILPKILYRGTDKLDVET
ncbi:MAG: tripartite tricarboxylate transporter TctA [Syntrophus sp. RIFOXYC2_FULL_54_9]|nr:MAG: tripartite tricarboxylate transporter TctA [Syntrophus sp. GWC2_56_31]OHE24899.1 MAG: tripartite tricarboxylate transporter TctA [Syntrophus sp. RIFOXYC2_FULL_54_9]HBB17817.1 tripartite tricarboxylate transporter TctA [Syntrophus sp. (in: bacteria)]